VSHQHLNKIPGILRVGVGVGVGAGAGAGAGLSAGVLAEAAHKHQAGVAVLKLVQARPYKPLRNPINQLRSKHVVVQVVSAVVSMVVEVKILLYTASALRSIGGNIQQAYRGRGALPFQQDFAEGSFGTFRLWSEIYYLYYN
jgi:hypothetical protein